MADSDEEEPGAQVVFGRRHQAVVKFLAVHPNCVATRIPKGLEPLAKCAQMAKPGKVRSRFTNLEPRKRSPLMTASTAASSSLAASALTT